MALRFLKIRIKTHLGGGGTPTGTLKLRPEIRTNVVLRVIRKQVCSDSISDVI